MKVVIFTEDTDVKLPPINRWTGKYGRGIDITEDSQIISLLESYNLAVPHDDIEMEDQYRKFLREFIRPARSMFAGMFSEVRIFADTLSEFVKTNLYVISGRYGLIQETEEIIPYSAHIQTEQDLGNLDKRTDFNNHMVDTANEFKFIILLLPKHYLLYLLKHGFFDRLNRESSIIIVTSKKLQSDFSQYNNVSVLERKGVARMGKVNRDKILEIIKSHSNSNEFNEV
jgi:cytoplasmic iron level regulating protein YaaA (DUF328/UPF0246 family)